MDSLAVVILNYKTWQDTLSEAKEIADNCGVCWSDIVIVDNCSQNDSVEGLNANKFWGYVLIENKNNMGYAAGNNIGLRYAYRKGYKYAWIVNNDVLIKDKEIISKILQIFSKDENIAAVSPDIYAPSGHMFNRDCTCPSFFDLTVGMLKYSKKGRKMANHGGFGYVYRPQGCCMFLDLDKMADVDYMDEATFLYSEEIILAERLCRKGYKCACCCDSYVIHNHSKTVKSVFDKKRIRKMQVNSFAYYLKKYRGYGRLKNKIGCWFYTVKLILLGG